MRLTVHNGRAGKYGTYNTKHNDRNFDTKNAQHIDQSRSVNNWYWRCDGSNKTFDEVERDFYIEHFGQALEAKNERYKKSGHKEDMRTMDEYRRNERNCPEETILQIGRVGETIEPDLLREICIKYINWGRETFSNIHILDAALHVDEQGAPHIHMRKVWIGHDKDGNEIVSQTRALEEMNIKRPHPEKKNDRYNNPKMTYTKMCRDHFIEICKEYGFDLELEPREASKSGLSLIEYKRQREQEKLIQMREENAKLTALLENAKLTALLENAKLTALLEKERAELEYLR